MVIALVSVLYSVYIKELDKTLPPTSSAFRCYDLRYAARSTKTIAVG